ncbi:MAG: alpha-galactosidase, partial [Lachnospiraceae bacterium]
PISYVKWDMNRSFSQCFSNGRDRSYQGKAQHKYILGVYEFYEKLITRHPDVLFESCASGGARFDPGMLYYAPQGWISDDTDAVERLKIQYGTSMVYPLVSMGSHVSASPNHQLQRRTSLKMRGDVAYFGTFGFELDLTKLPEEDLEEMKTQILFMKQYRDLIQQGTFYRLRSPFEGNYTAWMVVSADRKQALVGYYKTLQTINDSFMRLNLQGLLPQADYTVSEVLPTGTAFDPGQPPVSNPTMTCSGAELMSCGLIVSDRSSCKSGLPKNLPSGDFTSRIFELRCIE